MEKRLSPKKGLFAYAFAGRDITGKISRRYGIRGTEKK